MHRIWEGESAVCIGGGPSLTAEAVEATRGRARVVAVNDSYLIAPWADVCYFADSRWWQWHTDGIAKAWPWAKFEPHQVKRLFASFAGQKVSIENTGMLIADAEVAILHNRGSDKLCEEQNGLNTGSNSGYQAINLCVLAGAKRILLLGYDMRFEAGRSHSHNGHPLKMPEQVYSLYASRFDSMKPQLARLGVEIVNCSPGSAIKAFRRGDLEQELALCAPTS